VSRRTRSLAWAAVIATGAGAYALLAHWSNSHTDARNLGVVVAIAPPWLLAVALAWRSTLRVPALILCVAAAVAVAVYWRVLAAHFAWAYLLQQCGAYALLALTFGRSLRSDATPLCTRWADRVHGPLSPRVAAYTRRVTLAWTIFFALVAALLAIVFWLAPLPVWSAFANFGTLPLVIAMFVGEYLVRRQTLPQLAGTRILDGVRAYLSSEPTASVRRV
jgi:uncharacterized membrane protein